MDVVVSRKLTSRMYDGIRVRSMSFKGVCEKTEGFDSAAVAIMHECAPYDPTPESVADPNYPKRHILTSQFLDSNCILCANAVTVSDDSDTFTHPFDEFHNLGHVFRHAGEGIRVAHPETAHVLEKLAFPIRRKRTEDCVIADRAAKLK